MISVDTINAYWFTAFLTLLPGFFIGLFFAEPKIKDPNLIICITLIAVGIFCFTQGTILGQEYHNEIIKNQKQIDDSQLNFLDSHSCDDVRSWLSNATHNKINTTKNIIEHARDILISECLK